MNSLYICLALLVAATVAIQLPAHNFNGERRTFMEGIEHPKAAPSGWTVASESTQERVSLILALAQENLDVIDKLFWEVSDPKNPKYAQYLTTAQITELTAPKPENMKHLMSWLNSYDVTIEKLSENKDFLHVSCVATVCEELLKTQFSLFQHGASGKTIVRSLGPYSVPESVAPTLDFIAGVVGFPHMKEVIVSHEEVDNIPVNPNMLRERYNVTGTGSATNNSQAVAEFQGQYYSPSDLKKFASEFNVSLSNVSVIGTNDGDAPGMEANLDIQYIMGVAPGVPTSFYSNPNMDFWTDITAWLSQLQAAGTPWVHSISYGEQAAGPSGAYKDRTNTEFQKLGLRGISIIFASGDSGVGCELCWIFEPSFPATSPAVTSVGATRFANGKVGPEAAVEVFKSGGGFSRHFPQPSYQNATTAHYLSVAEDLPAKTHFESQNRGTPDVAALGIGFTVYLGGGQASVGGTSASAPTFAAVVSVLNSIRLNAGKPTLGFLNPFLYQLAAEQPSAFYDVTSGTNPDGCCIRGFSCAPGWDPVTGLGTPNFEVMAEAIKNL